MIENKEHDLVTEVPEGFLHIISEWLDIVKILILSILDKQISNNWLSAWASQVKFFMRGISFFRGPVSSEEN